MIRSKSALGLCCLLLVSPALLRVQAQGAKKAEPPPPKFELQLIHVADTDPHEFIWQVDGFPRSAFKSLSSYSLRKRVAGLPAGATIEWFPNDVRIGGEPSGEEVRRFRAFCEAEGVRFVVHPAG